MYANHSHISASSGQANDLSKKGECRGGFAPSAGVCGAPPPSAPSHSLLLARHRRRHASATRKVTQKDGLVELASQTAAWEVYNILSEAEFQQCTQAGIE